MKSIKYKRLYNEILENYTEENVVEISESCFSEHLFSEDCSVFEGKNINRMYLDAFKVEDFLFIKGLYARSKYIVTDTVSKYDKKAAKLEIKALAEYDKKTKGITDEQEINSITESVREKYTQNLVALQKEFKEAVKDKINKIKNIECHWTTTWYI